MITVEEAHRLVLDNAIVREKEHVELASAPGRVLAQNIVADRDFPPFDRVTMDGIAIDYDAYSSGKRNFLIEGIAPAGSPQLILQNSANCIEVMTGAMLPHGCDTVIRYEDLAIESDSAQLLDVTVNAQQNVHRRGGDRRVGQVVVHAGSTVGVGEVGVAATVGLAQLEVISLPRICVVSTGDEIVPVHAAPEDHQIRSSNVNVISALIANQGVNADYLHLIDDQTEVEKKLAHILAQYHVLILSGGVSKGKFDYVPGALEVLGVKKLFHRIHQRPGKPFWFGKNADCLVFALPGNPVSATMCCTRYVLPWLAAIQGKTSPPLYAVLGNDISFKPDLTLFQQASVQMTSYGQLTAHPVPGHGSGDLTSLVTADGFLELPRGRDLYRQGEVFRWWPFR